MPNFKRKSFPLNFIKAFVAKLKSDKRINSTEPLVLEIFYLSFSIENILTIQ